MTAMEPVPGRVDQPDRFFSRQNDRQSSRGVLGYGTSSTRVARFSVLQKKKPRAMLQADRASARLPLLVLDAPVPDNADLVFPQLIWRTMEVTGEVFYDLQISVSGRLKIDLRRWSSCRRQSSGFGAREQLVTHQIPPSAAPDGHPLSLRHRVAPRGAAWF